LKVFLNCGKWYLNEESSVVLVSIDLASNTVRNDSTIFRAAVEKLVYVEAGLKWTFAALSVEVNDSCIGLITLDEVLGAECATHTCRKIL